MDKFRVDSPTRVDLGGGTLDLWPLFCFEGPVYTLNYSLSIKTYAEVTPRQNTKEILIKTNFNDRKYSFSNLEELLLSKEEGLQLLIAAVRKWRPENGFELSFGSDSPVGAGLGGSSSLLVSLNKVLCHLVSGSIKDEDLVQLCANQEANVLKTPTGTQDYIPAIFTGLNLIQFDVNGFSIENHSRHPILNELKNSGLLVYTGRPHHSGLNNWEILKKYIDNDFEVRSAINDLAKLSLQQYSLIKKNDFNNLIGTFSDEFLIRKRLATGYVTSEIEELSAKSKEFGAKAIKICGAGGGGCVLLIGDQKYRDSFEKLANDLKMTVLEDGVPKFDDQKSPQY